MLYPENPFAFDYWSLHSMVCFHCNQAKTMRDIFGLLLHRPWQRCKYSRRNKTIWKEIVKWRNFSLILKLHSTILVTPTPSNFQKIEWEIYFKTCLPTVYCPVNKVHACIWSVSDVLAWFIISSIFKGASTMSINEDCDRHETSEF